MEDDEYTTSKMEEIKLEEGTNGAQVKQEERTPMSVTNGGQEESRSPSASHDGVKSRSGSADTPSSNRPSKLSRKASQKLAASREPVLFDHLPDMTAESCNFFQLIPDCLYGSKHLGSTDNDALDCECREEWRTLPTEPLWSGALLTFLYRQWRKYCMWRGLGLHQSSDKNGM